MVDFESYICYGPGDIKLSNQVLRDSQECTCSTCQKNTTWDFVCGSRFDKLEKQDVWEEAQFYLCPPRVLGYILAEKQWAQLQVTLVQDIPEQHLDNSWDRVKLADGEDTKKMILDLVNGHGTADSRGDDNGLVVDDIVAKKGKGLVILLYGECP